MDKRESDMVIDDVREAQKDDALVRGFWRITGQK